MGTQTGPSRGPARTALHGGDTPAELNPGLLLIGHEQSTPLQIYVLRYDGNEEVHKADPACRHRREQHEEGMGAVLKGGGDKALL